jgi:tRNA (cytosine38-C5)-methyltransferase
LLSLEHCTAADLHIRQQQQQQQQRQQHKQVSSSRQRPPPLLWTLSPPCQPYTTTANSKQADAQDARASSLSHLLQLLPQLEQLPSHILLENVVSFHGSRSHQQLLEVLQQLGYQVADVALCPSQLGIPHLRRRHYTLAVRLQQQQQQQQQEQGQQQQQHLQGQKHDHQQQQGCECANINGSGSITSSSSAAWSDATLAQLQLLAHGQPPIQVAAAAHQHRSLRSCLELDWSQQTRPLRECSAAVQQQVLRYALPLSRVGRYFKVLDLVAPSLSRHSNCFTKGYGKSILGTGSYLLEDAAARLLARQDSRGRWHLDEDPYSSSSSSRAALQAVGVQRDAAGCSSSSSISRNEGTGQHQVDEGEVPPLLRVRCFTPREVAALQGFPASFSFPSATTDRQAYALLGNSVSVNAVSYLVRLLLHDVLDIA